MYDYDGLPGDGKCWYGLDRRSCKSDQLYMAKCSGSSRQKFDIIEQSNGEVQIRLGNGKNKCLERDGRKIELHGCSSSNSKQLFYIPNGSLGGRRFELSQRSYSSQCVTQDHVRNSWLDCFTVGSFMKKHHRRLILYCVS